MSDVKPTDGMSLVVRTVTRWLKGGTYASDADKKRSERTAFLVMAGAVTFTNQFAMKTIAKARAGKEPAEWSFGKMVTLFGVGGAGLFALFRAIGKGKKMMAGRRSRTPAAAAAAPAAGSGAPAALAMPAGTPTRAAPALGGGTTTSTTRPTIVNKAPRVPKGADAAGNPAWTPNQEKAFRQLGLPVPPLP